MNTRRDLLRLFGAGAVIAPVLVGKPLLEASSRLVEPAKVELVEPGTVLLTEGTRCAEVKQMALTLEMADGSKRQFFSSRESGVKGQGVLSPNLDLSVSVSMRARRTLQQPFDTSSAWLLSEHMIRMS